jgi:hypothetical protein
MVAGEPIADQSSKERLLKRLAIYCYKVNTGRPECNPLVTFTGALGNEMGSITVQRIDADISIYDSDNLKRIQGRFEWGDVLRTNVKS